MVMRALKRLVMGFVVMKAPKKLVEVSMVRFERVEMEFVVTKVQEGLVMKFAIMKAVKTLGMEAVVLKTLIDLLRCACMETGLRGVTPALRPLV
jgi:hypothetical protein